MMNRIWSTVAGTVSVAVLEALLAGSASAGEAKRLQGSGSSGRVEIPTSAAQVQVIKALPLGESGAGIKGKPEFPAVRATPKQGCVTVKIGEEPIWIVEGDLPKENGLKPKDSPFGFHPASTGGGWGGYACAQDIGVVWDRGGFYFMWVLVQPDLTKPDYDWRRYDRYFRNLPNGFKPMKNITVCHDGMVRRRKDRPSRGERLGYRPVDLSWHLEGTTYRPKDPKAYARWVRAAVERYDGDGKEDMPGLRTPVKHWQVDNEPPRGRDGYVDLVRVTCKAVKEADPEAKVLIGGFEFPDGSRRERHWEEEQLPMLKELKGRGFDIFDFHWFGLVGDWKKFPAVYGRIRKDLVACGFGTVPAWIAEMGTYSGEPASHPRAEAFHRQSERAQAGEMLKRHAVALGEGVEKIFWAWGMTEGFGDLNDNDFFDNTGFVYDGRGVGDPGRGTKKIVYHSYKKMTGLLCYWNGKSPERLTGLGKGVWAYRFPFAGTGGKRGVILAWIENATLKLNLVKNP